MHAAEAVVRAEISRRRILSYARFMELALYSPECGYYETHSRTIGRSGDYFTSAGVGEIFGHLLGSQFANWLHAHSAPHIQLVESGAHDGRLSADILSWLQQQEPGLFSTLHYWIVEPSPRRREWQRQTLQPWSDRVQWASHLSEVPYLTGVIFSNELLDAFPVHRLQWNQCLGRWEEWGVGVEEVEGALTWMPLPIPEIDISKALAQAGMPFDPAFNAALPPNYQIELCPAACEWWETAARRLRCGRLLTVDYGLTADELFRPERTQGTARAYQGHRVSGELLANPGEQDLTAHINFSALQRTGEQAGLLTDGCWHQGDFLTRILESAWAKDKVPEWSSAQRRQFQTLVHPEHLGRKFRVLVQSRRTMGNVFTQPRRH